MIEIPCAGNVSNYVSKFALNIQIFYLICYLYLVLLRTSETQSMYQTTCILKFHKIIHLTVKLLNFARDLILQVVKIRKIKYQQKFKIYIDSNSKTSRFVKLKGHRTSITINIYLFISNSM